MWTNENLKTVIEALDDMIPAMGSVKNINKNRCLERFRTAQNVVHDIFNNGLMNRGKQLKVLECDAMRLIRFDTSHWRHTCFCSPLHVIEPFTTRVIFFLVFCDYSSSISVPLLPLYSFSRPTIQ